MIGYGDETDRFHVYIVRPIWSPETLHMTDVVTRLCIEIAALGTVPKNKQESNTYLL